MTKEEKAELRGDLFRHLDGVVTAPVAYELYQKGVLTFLLAAEEVTLTQLVKEFGANEGYLNVGLHTLAAQGWIEYNFGNESEIIIGTNEKSEIAFSLVQHYEAAVKLLKISEQYHPRKFEVEPFQYLEQLFQNYCERYQMAPAKNDLEQSIQDQVLKHIEGIIVGPTVVALGMSGMFHKYFMEASFHPGEFHKDATSFGCLLDMFVHLGWFSKKNETYRFTEKGMFYARRASAYGVTVSYIPAFRKIDKLLFGDPTLFYQREKGSAEIHVDRAMNVWGSGGAHASYFKVIDEVIIELFNRPIEQQPKGILDMGCGNGAFLIHLYEVIERKTLRGTMLDEHPLFLIGADFNKAALDVTRSNIIQAEIWAKLIWGDIGRPDLLAEDLQERYQIELRDLLNVRTFLDHNRIWQDPSDSAYNGQGKSTGAFAFKGRRIQRDEIEANLYEHFLKWKPHLDRFGLLVIELHTLSPSVIAKNIGKTPATAYNATHGFSDQFIVEIDIFKKVASDSGLNSDPSFFRKFPDSELATVSVNLLTANHN